MHEPQRQMQGLSNNVHTATNDARLAIVVGVGEEGVVVLRAGASRKVGVVASALAAGWVVRGRVNIYR